MEYYSDKQHERNLWKLLQDTNGIYHTLSELDFFFYFVGFQPDVEDAKLQEIFMKSFLHI